MIITASPVVQPMAEPRFVPRPVVGQKTRIVGERGRERENGMKSKENKRIEVKESEELRE